ncbi:MAG: hypothetical protein ACI4TM_10545 [Candidatus Cryptobacteroides sp.]
MDSPFIYDRYVTGKNFIGRKTDCQVLANLLGANENVVMFEPPKTGKMSVVQQTLFNMRIGGKAFSVASMDFFNKRTMEEFLTCFGTAVVRSVASTPEEYEKAVSEGLSGTHFLFDRQAFATSDRVVSISGKPDMNDMEKLMSLPETLATLHGTHIFVIISEFQNILEDDAHEDLFHALEGVMARNREKGEHSSSFILCGSRVNAMKYIFTEKKWFYRLIEHLPLNTVEDREIIDYVVKGYLLSGKVVEKELVMGMCRMFRNNLWYINHFTAICDSMSKGYINEGIMMEALRTMISIHEPKFTAIMDNLTNHQISFLRAVLDGVTKFSSTDAIDRYSLNSSANVRRVKDALKKKEILTFDEKDEPVVLDPLFRYWIQKYYFEMEQR